MRIILIRSVAFVLSVSFAAYGQNHPYPANVSEPPVPCTGCPGNNPAGEPNDGLPTVPYDVPLVSHAGRYVSSSSTPDATTGLRTIRAGLVRVRPSLNRIYLQLGSAIGAYNLDSFFSNRLFEPVVDAGGIKTGNFIGGRTPLEKALRVDAFIYPEAQDSQWITTAAAGQERLHDFDFDDRQFVYYGSSVFGWGQIFDDGRTDGKGLPRSHQVTEPLGPEMRLFSMKSGSSYFLYVSDSSSTKLWDVDVSFPTLVATRSGAANQVREWSKNEAAAHVAIVHADNTLRVHSYAALISGAPPLAEHSGTIGTVVDAAFDAAGNVWAVERTAEGGSLWKLAAGSYTKTTHTLPAGFRPERLHSAGGYLAVTGTVPVDAERRNDLLLFNVSGGTPQLLDTGGYFRRYYHAAPAGFAQPEGHISDAEPFLYVWNDRTYLFYSAGGLGDVYRLGNVLAAPVVRITSISPAMSPPEGGTVVTVEGRNFSQDAVVRFGDISAPTAFVSSRRLTAVAPAHDPGAVLLAVTSGGQKPPGTRFLYTVAMPANFTARGNGPNAVALRWDLSPEATSYTIFRNHIFDGSTARDFSIDFDVTPNTAYVYAIEARDRDGVPSARTPLDLAVPMDWDDTSFVPGLKVKATHLSELRTAVNAARTLAGLPAATWTMSATILAVQLEELRTALNQALTALGIPPVTFTDPSLAGLPIKAVHVRELFDAVR
jgi:IPT/TIG domain